MIKCRNCGNDRLRWQEVDGKFRLFEGDTLHVCPEVPLSVVSHELAAHEDPVMDADSKASVELVGRGHLYPRRGKPKVRVTKIKERATSARVKTGIYHGFGSDIADIVGD